MTNIKINVIQRRAYSNFNGSQTLYYCDVIDNRTGKILTTDWINQKQKSNPKLLEWLLPDLGDFANGNQC